MRLSHCLRSRVMHNHTKEQREGVFHKTWRDRGHFIRYLNDRCLVHAVLDPVFPESPGFTGCLHNDLRALDADYMTAVPETNLYSQYLHVLREKRARPLLLAHAYCFIGAHLSGGGKQIASSASDVLPVGFLDESMYYNTTASMGAIVSAIDQEALYMPCAELTDCIQEIDTAYRFGTMLLLD